MPDIRHILWPTDFSELSRRAVPLVQELANRFSARVTAIHVIQNPPMVSAAGAPNAAAFSLAGYMDGMREHAERGLNDLVGSELGASVETAWEVLTGNPAHMIVDFAAEQGVDLIILCTHGESGLARFIFGSVAEKVVRLSSCPVLTVPSGNAENKGD